MQNSVYEFACICGQHFEVEDPGELMCPRCGRAAVVEWAPLVDRDLGDTASLGVTASV